MNLTLPYPPSANRYYRSISSRRFGWKRVLLSRQGRSYRQKVFWVVQCNWLCSTLLGRLRVTLLVHPPDKRRRDMDNVQKAVFDALQHAGIFRDDEQIDEIRVERGTSQRPGWVKVTVEEIGDATTSR